MKTSILLALSLMILSTSWAQKTTRGGLHAAKEAAEIPASTATVDTVVKFDAHDIDINGYDKPLRSRRETFFVTNNSNRATEAVAFTITYLDTKERMLHQRKANLPLAIPAGETRQASLKSWDPQLAFYYTLSTAPQRSSQATPYNIKITVDTIFYAR